MTDRRVDSYNVIEAFFPPEIESYPAMREAREILEQAGARVGESWSGRGIAERMCRRCHAPIHEHEGDALALKGMHRLCLHLDQYHSREIDPDQWCGQSGCPSEPREDQAPVPVRERTEPGDLGPVWCDDAIELGLWTALLAEMAPRPGMYLGYVTLWNACTYFHGFDHGRSTASPERGTNALSSFNRWLTRRHPAQNFTHSAYIRRETVPELERSGSRRDLTNAEDERATDHLFALFKQYLAECAGDQPRSKPPMLMVSFIGDNDWRATWLQDLEDLDVLLLEFLEEQAEHFALDVTFAEGDEQSDDLDEFIHKIDRLEVWRRLPTETPEDKRSAIMEQLREAMNTALEHARSNGLADDLPKLRDLVDRVERRYLESSD